MAEDYEGEVCFVGHDHEAADGHPLEGGWFYTVVPIPDAPPPGPGESPQTMPGEKLHFDAKTGKYRLAKEGDKSHQEQHHKQLTLLAVNGAIGEPQTKEQIEAAHRHLDALEQRLGKLDPHEHDHLLQRPDEISAARQWLNSLGGAK
jgi:hypothetical protein